MAETEAAAPATPAVPSAPAPEAASAKEPVTVADKFAATKARAKEAAAPKPEAKPVESAAPKVDPDLEAVERILKQDARVKAEAKRVADEKAAWTAERDKERKELDAARAARAAREKGDVIGALKALGLTEADIYEGDDSVLFKLADARSKKPEIDEKTRLEAVVAEKLKEKEDAEKTAAEAKDKEEKEKAAKVQSDVDAQVTTARDAYSENVLAIAAANPSKYPAMVALGITAKVVTDYAWNTIVNSKGEVVLSEEEALADLEKHYAAVAKKASGVEDKPAPVETKAPHRPISVNPGWQSSTPTPSRPPATTLADKFARVKEEARRKFAAK